MSHTSLADLQPGINDQTHFPWHKTFVLAFSDEQRKIAHSARDNKNTHTHTKCRISGFSLDVWTFGIDYRSATPRFLNRT